MGDASSSGGLRWYNQRYTLHLPTRVPWQTLPWPIESNPLLSSDPIVASPVGWRRGGWSTYRLVHADCPTPTLPHLRCVCITQAPMCLMQARIQLDGCLQFSYCLCGFVWCVMTSHVHPCKSTTSHTPHPTGQGIAAPAESVQVQSMQSPT